jgi:hypothetical protein
MKVGCGLVLIVLLIVFCVAVYESAHHSGERAKATAEAVIELAREQSQYIEKWVRIESFESAYYTSYSDRRVAGVKFKLRNAGTRTLERIDVAVFFLNARGDAIGEETYSPITSEKPLRPGYVWQLDEGQYYPAKNIASEWKEGAVKTKIAYISFAAFETPDPLAAEKAKAEAEEEGRAKNIRQALAKKSSDEEAARRLHDEKAKIDLVKFIQEKARSGSGRYQLELGERYLRGDGVDTNLVLAKLWLGAACSNETPAACVLLGRLNNSMK